MLWHILRYDNGTTGEYITSTEKPREQTVWKLRGDMGKAVIENNTLMFYRNVISEGEHNKINKEPFGKPECWECKPVDFNGTDHDGNFEEFHRCIAEWQRASCRGEEGINGLTISKRNSFECMDGERRLTLKIFRMTDFTNCCVKKIKNSKVVKKCSR